MTEAFTEVAYEYMIAQRRSTAIVPIGDIICPQTVTLENSGAHTLTDAYDLLVSTADAVHGEFMRFIELWDPDTFMLADAIRKKQSSPQTILRAKPLTVAVLPHPDTRGRTYIEAGSRFNPLRRYGEVGFTAMRGTKPRRVSPALRLDGPGQQYPVRSSVQAERRWGFAQYHYDNLQRFRKVVDELSKTVQTSLSQPV